MSVCDSCLARTWLLARLSGHLDVERGRIWELLALSNQHLIDAVAGSAMQEVSQELDGFGSGRAQRARNAAGAAGLELICRCSPKFPQQLLRLQAPPAVLHVAGGLERLHELCAADPVAIVGARRATAYGLEMAKTLARGLGTARVTVVSGLAAGVDAAAHCGAVEAGGQSLAVLPGPANRPYPVANTRLCRQLLERGVVMSEMGPDVALRSWMFAARNRLIAALADLTVVVQAAEGSGSLLTVAAAREIGGQVGAVPGPVTSRLSDGPNQVLHDGGTLIRGANDALDALFGERSGRVAPDMRVAPTPSQAVLLTAIGDGLDSAQALLAALAGDIDCLADLARLELTGHVRRGPGGRLTVVP